MASFAGGGGRSQGEGHLLNAISDDIIASQEAKVMRLKLDLEQLRLLIGQEESLLQGMRERHGKQSPKCCSPTKEQAAKSGVQGTEVEVNAGADDDAEVNRRLFHQLDQPVYEYDWKAHRMVKCNDAFVRMLGFEDECEALASTFSKRCHPDDQEKALAHIKPTCIERFRCRVLRKDGSVIWVEIHGIILENQRMLVQWRDVETEMALEAERQSKVAEQARADAERGMNDYLAHEVRNPLSVAIAALRFVTSRLGEKTNPGVISDIEMARSSLCYIDELMTDVLDLNKFISGKIDLHPAPCSILHDVLRPVVAMLARRDAPVTLTIATKCDALWVEVDRLRLKQVITNLAKNALKFVPKGFIRLGAERTSADTVTIWCEDSGPGIPMNKAERLFDQYSQLDKHDQGTGIGLALCRQIILQMKGTIGVDPSYESGSDHGPGARFCAALPLMEIPEPAHSNLGAEEVVHTVRLRGPYRALVVDDDPMVLHTMARTLNEEIGIRFVDEVESGEAAIAKKVAYDLIIVDHYMSSRMTGTETIAALRANGSKAFIIGSSANNMEREHLEAGADAFWRKPIPAPAVLSRTLRDSLPLPKGPWSVLVADDDAMCRFVLLRKLRKTLSDNILVLEASNGREAMEALDQREFDLMVVDEHLGDEIKGTDIVLAARRAGSDAVIVAYTSDTIANDHTKAGCDLSWNKAVDTEVMQREIHECICKGALLPFGLQEFFDMTSTDEYATLTSMFVRQISAEVCTLRSLVDEGLWEEAEALSHKMKSSACALRLNSINDVTNLNAALKCHIAEGNNEDDVHRLCEIAASKFEVVINFLRESPLTNNE